LRMPTPDHKYQDLNYHDSPPLVVDFIMESSMHAYEVVQSLHVTCNESVQTLLTVKLFCVIVESVLIWHMIYPISTLWVWSGDYAAMMVN
jgi:hypothetical protein